MRKLGWGWGWRRRWRERCGVAGGALWLCERERGCVWSVRVIKRARERLVRRAREIGGDFRAMVLKGKLKSQEERGFVMVNYRVSLSFGAG